MSFDVDRAQDVGADGVMFSLSGVDKIWVGGGSDAPADDAPIGSQYYQTDKNQWTKETAGSGADKWVKTAVATNAGTVTASFGGSGNLPTDTWLKRAGNVSSNIVGIPADLTTAVLKVVDVQSEDIDTFTVGIYTHESDEINLTLIHTVTITAARGKVDSGLSIAIPAGKQIAARVTSGSARNAGVTALINGDFS